MEKGISRRDALRLLAAAAGAAAVSNLPGKWSTPQLMTGVLPVHAQGSPVSDCLVVIKNLVRDGQSGPVPGGSQQTWGLLVQNPNAHTVSGIEVEDQLPTAVLNPSIGTVPFGTAQIDSQGLVTWSIPALSPYAYGILEIDFEVQNLTQTVLNIATITQPLSPDVCPAQVSSDQIFVIATV